MVALPDQHIVIIIMWEGATIITIVEEPARSQLSRRRLELGLRLAQRARLATRGSGIAAPSSIV
jgi:hypothetical protein